MTYAEKLKDPRWQRRRLERLNATNFTCQQCGDTKSTLHVHHRYYEKDLDPWEYDDRVLVVLCDFCHEVTHGYKASLEKLLCRYPSEIEEKVVLAMEALSKADISLWAWIQAAYHPDLLRAAWDRQANRSTLTTELNRETDRP